MEPMNCDNAAFLLAISLTAQAVRWIVWAGLIALTISLLVLLRTETEIARRRIDMAAHR